MDDFKKYKFINKKTGSMTEKLQADQDGEEKLTDLLMYRESVDS